MVKNGRKLHLSICDKPHITVCRYGTYVSTVSLLINKSTSGLLVVGGAASDAWLGPFGLWDATVRIPPDNPFFAAHRGEGWPVESGANRLRLEALGAEVRFDLVLLGTTSNGNAESSSSAWSSGTSAGGSSSSSAWSSSAWPSSSSSAIP